jgi:hypothetical protein
MTLSMSEFVSQFNLSFFKGRIIDVEPITVNSNTGNIFEQDIDFQLENGIVIPISDNDLGCKKDDIGHEKRIQIANGARNSIRKCDSDNPKFGIFPNPINPGHSPTICGIILRMIESPEEKNKLFKRHAILDVGIGQIWVIIWKDHKEDFSTFHEGDCVLITDGLLDVIKVI